MFYEIIGRKNLLINSVRKLLIKLIDKSLEMFDEIESEIES